MHSKQIDVLNYYLASRMDSEAASLYSDLFVGDFCLWGNCTKKRTGNFFCFKHSRLFPFLIISEIFKVLGRLKFKNKK